MRTIELELTDAEGDPLFVAVTRTGYVAWGWTYDSMRNDIVHRFQQSEWEDSTLRRPCIPFVMAALAALKEEGDA